MLDVAQRLGLDPRIQLGAVLAGRTEKAGAANVQDSDIRSGEHLIGREFQRSPDHFGCAVGGQLRSLQIEEDDRGLALMLIPICWFTVIGSAPHCHEAAFVRRYWGRCFSTKACIPSASCS